MADWTPIPDVNLEPAAPGRSIDALALRDNPIAIAEGAAGAPRIQTAALDALVVTEAKVAANAISNGKLAANAVTWGKISTGLQQTSGAATDFTFTGGVRTLGWGLGSSGTFKAEFDGYHNSGGSISGGRLIGGGGTAYFQAAYINSSPPWDMGDGEIPLFIFAIVDSSGTPVAVDISDAPPWAYNGPTDITPYRDDPRTGAKFRRVRQIVAEFGTLKNARAAGLTRDEIFERLVSDPLVDQKITQQLKNADMGLFPSPLKHPQPGQTIILLDPVSPLVRRLAALRSLGSTDPDDNVTDLILRKAVAVGNEPLPRAAPPGVVVVAATLR